MVQIGVRVRNGCGWTNWEYNNWAVVDCSGGGLLLSVTPNPANSEATLTIESEAKDESFDVNAEWDFEIFSESQLLKINKTGLRGKSTTIQTAGWKEGVYVVRVKYKPEKKPMKILTGKLVVKR